jgi:hypothetical protein
VTSRATVVVCTCVSCWIVVAALACGCSSPDASAAKETGKWQSTATEVPQPAEYPPRAYVEGLAPARELVRSYVASAAAGDRAGMTGAYLPETRRSAETIVARDLELAGKDGPYSSGPRNTSSVFLFDDALFPPNMAPSVEAEDEARLRELRPLHDGASLVVASFSDGSRRTFFVVVDGSRWHLVP